MGLDPTRQHRKTKFDYFFVAASVIAAVGLVLWAFFS